jgi:hypothetical protein
MKQLLKMTAGPATALLALAYVAIATPAAAAQNEYCRQDVTSGMRSCRCLPVAAAVVTEIHSSPIPAAPMRINRSP